eukprot:CAMPEP_0204158924 /NCGR_PEP_ID=MMETSP0361-20130328/32541_1 /ASSEMBLY_ACC=CAM_ASM_000343 /TAXON_ID=268821 /ORGANISM="Scrippsiella Hangoei, Strain SHTV-5" /LENGTH=49 /DNA_ID= /DNA_START= /DNA_END= /DNA_ORIENTATION=
MAARPHGRLAGGSVAPLTLAIPLGSQAASAQLVAGAALLRPGQQRVRIR